MYSALHTHSMYSVLDGMSRPEEIAARAKELGIPAVGITDHGNLGGYFDIKECFKEQGIKYIPGIEAYFIPDRSMRDDKRKYYHLSLYAKNGIGYKNLCKLLSKAALDEQLFYYKARIDFKLLEEHHDGLVITAGCMGGPIYQAFFDKNYNYADELYKKFKDLVGNDFYFEFMLHPESAGYASILEDSVYSKQIEIIKTVLERYPNEKYIITNDAHYPTRDCFETHEAMLCIQTHNKLSNPKRYSFQIPEFYIKSEDELREVFNKAGFGGIVDKAFAYTMEISNKCEDFEVKAPALKFNTPIGFKDNYEYFLTLIKQGWKNRNLPTTTGYTSRLREEIEVFKSLNFIDYMLIITDFIQWAKAKDIFIGPGRGSVAGSLVAYLLNITDIDPIPYGLLFTRFLNKARISPPDIDTDVQTSRRDELKAYIAEKYKGGLVHIGTYITMQSKAALRDTCGVLDISTDLLNHLLTLVPDFQSDDDANKRALIKDSYESLPELKTAVYKYPNIFEKVFRLEGLIKSEGRHAAGVIISENDITDYVPLRLNKGNPTTQYEDVYLEQAGLLKIDILGLAMLDTIQDTMKQIASKGIKIDFDNIPLDDRRVWSNISTGYTAGIFQLESQGMKELIKKIKPKCIEDLGLVIALYRPGPARSGMLQTYIECRKDPSQVFYEHPAVERALSSTYNVIVYQEQVVKLVQELAGYTEPEADLFRKIIGKKKPGEMKIALEEFVKRCKERDIDDSLAEKIVKQLIAASAYLFNLSHSIAYAILGYKAAWFKTYYPLEFTASFINNESDNEQDYYNFLREAIILGIPIINPKMNQSKAKTCTIDNKVYLGINRVKGIGDVTAKDIEEGGPYESYDHFISKMHGRRINVKVISALIDTGYFDGLGQERKKMMAKIKKEKFDPVEFVKYIGYDALKIHVLNEDKCPLRTEGKLVFGEGQVPSDILILGMNPGQDEMRVGRPFVGASGQELRKILQNLNIEQTCYITNTVLHGTKDNRVPTKTEAKKCTQWLQAQIALVKPKVVVTLGNFPLEILTNLTGINQYHGQPIPTAYAGINFTVVPTFHPSYGLHSGNPKIFEDIENDIKLARELVVTTYRDVEV